MKSAIASFDITRYNRAIIVGDFNIDLSDLQSTPAIDLLSSMAGFGMHHLVTDHTRVTSSSSSTIDLVFSSCPRLVPQVNVVSPLGSSDHCSLSCSLSLCRPTFRIYRRKIWLYQKTDFDALNDALEDSLPPEAVLDGGNVNSTWPLFKTAFLDTVHRFIPNRLVHCKKSLPPWITGEVRNAIRKHKAAHRRAKRLGTPAVWKKFRHYRNETVLAVRKAKQEFFSSICSPFNDSSKDFWKAYHSLSKSNARMPPKLSDGISTATSPNARAAMLNDFFKSCFSAKSLSKPCPSSPTATSSPPATPSTATLDSLSCDGIEVLHVISKLRDGTSSGPDEISARMIKRCSTSICGRLACIFNSSFDSGIVPDDWKISRITPIHKKGDPGLVQNYRPISLLSLIAKLQERIVHNKLMDFLTGQDAISASQFGFRPKSSTQEALISMTQVWHQHLEEGGSTLCVFLDLAKAFDSVPHHRVISALSNAGVSGCMLSWFYNYLWNRKQYVALDGISSPLAAVTSGVPQGSILGPLLFIATFNGIFHLPTSSTSDLTGYADDVTYSMKVLSQSDMDIAAADLSIISDWIEEEGFKLNVEKVKAMMISRKKDPPQVSLRLLGQPIETVSSFRLLGITVTNNLLWNQHILEASKKAKKILGFVYRVFGSSGQHCLARLYKSIVLPHLDYCSSLWDPHYKVHVNRLESVQTFAARMATKCWSDDGKGLKARLGWPELAVRRLQQKVSLCRRIVAGNSIIPPSFFTPHPRPSLSHKNSAPLFRPFVRTNQHKHSFKLSAVGAWNGIPEEIVSCTSDRGFKTRLRQLYPHS